MSLRRHGKEGIVVSLAVLRASGTHIRKCKETSLTEILSLIVVQNNTQNIM